MAAFDNFYQEAREYKQANPPRLVKNVIKNNPNLNMGILKYNIENTNNMSDQELRNFIYNSFYSILNTIFFGKESKKYIEYFKQLRFLTIFTEVIEDITSSNNRSNNVYLDNDVIVKCNTICYNYITWINKDKNVETQMLRLAKVVNKYNRLPRLLGLGLSEKVALILLMARYSSLDINVCIKRVNFIIINQPKELMSEQMIDGILRTIFDMMTDMVHFFTPFMLDVLPPRVENDDKTDWDSIELVDSTMNLVVLNILNELPSQVIRNILLNYSENITSSGKRNCLRFSMNTISDDYYRINNVIYDLKTIEGVSVP